MSFNIKTVQNKDLEARTLAQETLQVLNFCTAKWHDLKKESEQDEQK
jgi:hypothetical protein